MTILDSHGFLPEGIHEMSMDQVREHFGKFRSNESRAQMFGRLQNLYEKAKKVGFVRYIVVDGSYVTSKPDPNDIDIVIVVDPEVLNREEYKPTEYEIISNRRIRRAYKFDAFVVPEHSGALDYYIQLFSRVKGGGPIRKGVVKVTV